jgi:hypothetical protein
LWHSSSKTVTAQPLAATRQAMDSPMTPPPMTAILFAKAFTLPAPA